MSGEQSGAVEHEAPTMEELRALVDQAASVRALGVRVGPALFHHLHTLGIEEPPTPVWAGGSIGDPPGVRVLVDRTLGPWVWEPVLPEHLALTEALG